MSRDKKVQYDINREVAKILKLWSIKLDKYKNTYKYDCSLSGKAFERRIKTIEDQAKRQVKASKVSKPVEHQQKPEFRKVQLKMNQIKSENCNRKWIEWFDLCIEWEQMSLEDFEKWDILVKVV